RGRWRVCDDVRFKNEPSFRISQRIERNEIEFPIGNDDQSFRRLLSSNRFQEHTEKIAGERVLRFPGPNSFKVAIDQPLNGSPPVRNDHNGRSTASNSKTVSLRLAKNVLKQHLAWADRSLQLFQRNWFQTVRHAVQTRDLTAF